jgi:hypothetical protein
MWPFGGEDEVRRAGPIHLSKISAEPIEALTYTGLELMAEVRRRLAERGFNWGDVLSTGMPLSLTGLVDGDEIS